MRLVTYYNKYQKLLLFLMICLFFQFYTIPFLGSHLKAFMVATLVVAFLIVPNFGLERLYTFEKIWLFSYFYLAVSLAWAANFGLGLQLVLGEIILLLFYYVLKNLLCNNDIEQIESVFKLSFRLFVYISLVLYVLGLMSIYVWHNEGSVAILLNESSMRIYGCYKEWILVRFMGLAESPNNYAYFASIIMWFFVWKGERIDATITFITLVCTLSTTVYIALAVQALLYFYFGGKLSFKVLLSCILFYFLISYLLQFSDIQAIVDDRVSRNATGSGRFSLWDFSIDKINDSPILGYGINQSRTLFTEREYASSHNNILEMGLSLGYLGCCIYIFFLLSLLRKTFSYSRIYGNPFVGQLAAAFIIFGFANNNLHIEYTPFVLALMAFYMTNNNLYNDNN